MSLCRACLDIVGPDGDTFSCDIPAPHPGIAHHSYRARASWCSHGEALTALRRHADANGRHR